MNTARSIVLAGACAVVAACATAPTPHPQPQPAAAAAQPATTPASALVDRAGDSVETAVEVPADATNGGVDFENDWIYDRVGRFRREGGGTGVQGGRRYDVVEVETPKGDHYKFFFDITESWKRWQKPQ